eukprot:TRINITY_DN12998_c1_g2_i1.p1 TRINITY_DN12998_c1_g2~~TRINITY_DN12998_c1_g2_i1.p1  ORF type:complete len:630 (+),score=276.27 TRINITY_DN12998_c1_g2_i1:87-1892(+)
MAQNKKLTAEIDRTVKKIAEGIELFDTIWDKLHSSSAANQKDKFQGELKTEIKKLQRMRDQIKTWQANSDVRDKRAIDEARRQIEQKMEQFKACEREAKIKTYSKIGLSLERRDDPEEQARETCRTWIRAAVDSLSLQVQNLEAECEGLASKKRKRATKASDKSEEKIADHKFHIGRLELLILRIDRELVQLDDVEGIQELVQEYVDHNSDKHYDATGMEEIYEDLVPEDWDPDVESDEQLTTEKNDSLASLSVSKASREEKKRKKKEADESSKASTPTTPSIPNALPTPPSHSLASEEKKKEEEKKEKKDAPAPAAKATGTPTATAAAVKAPQPPATQANYAAAVKNAPAAVSKKGGTPQATPPQQAIDRPTSLSRQAAAAAAAPVARTASKNRDSAPPSPVTPPVKGQQPRAVVNNASLSGAAQAVSGGPPPAGAAKPLPPPPAQPLPGMSEAQKQNIEKMLQQSANNLPIPEDTRKRQPYVPPNPYETPSFYPQQPHEAFQQAETFERFDVDTLFFIFYYQQSTYQQYLAAKELKRQSWRFHKRCWTWFQRHQPPTMVEEEYEQGSYVYFDFEDGWTSRLKEEFTFKYCYLEDELASV